VSRPASATMPSTTPFRSDGGPWANYDNHGNVITTLPANAFTEMGVDITNVLGESPCLSTFMGKTRSSASFTSELKDFAGPTSFRSEEQRLNSSHQIISYA